MRYLNIIISSIIALSLGACGDSDSGMQRRLKSDIRERNKIIRNLRKEISILRDRMEDQKVRIAELSVELEGGLAIEEKRKALSEKESRLNSLEKLLDERQHSLAEEEKHFEDRQQQLAEEKSKFLEEQKEGFENIGRAQKMEEDYDELKEELRIAQHLANNWLKLFFGAGIFVICLIATLLVFILKYRRYRQDSKNFGNALRIIDGDMTIDPEYKQLIAKSLGRNFPRQQTIENE